MENLQKKTKNLQSSQIENENLTKLLEENLKISQEIKEMVKHINNYVAWQKIFALLKFILIIIPLIIGFLYLPPLIKDFFNQYSSLMSGCLTR